MEFIITRYKNNGRINVNYLCHNRKLYYVNGMHSLAVDTFPNACLYGNNVQTHLLSAASEFQHVLIFLRNKII